MSIQINENGEKLFTNNNSKSLDKIVSDRDIINFEHEMTIDSTKEIQSSDDFKINNDEDDNSKNISVMFVDDLVKNNPKSLSEFREILEKYNFTLKEKQDLILQTLQEIKNNKEIADSIVTLMKKELSLIILKIGMINNMLTRSIKPELD